MDKETIWEMKGETERKYIEKIWLTPRGGGAVKDEIGCDLPILWL